MADLRNVIIVGDGPVKELQDFTGKTSAISGATVMLV